MVVKRIFCRKAKYESLNFLFEHPQGPTYSIQPFLRIIALVAKHHLDPTLENIILKS